MIPNVDTGGGGITGGASAAEDNSIGDVFSRSAANFGASFGNYYAAPPENVQLASTIGKAVVVVCVVVIGALWLMKKRK